MWSQAIERGLWPRRWAPAHALWWGPLGLWDAHPAPGAAPQHHASFEAWAQAHPGRPCTLWLSSWWLHECPLDAGLPLGSDDAVMAYARGLLGHYHGPESAHWPLAAWHTGLTRGVSALHGLPVATLQATCAQTGVSLRSLQPWWSQALALAVRQAPPLQQAAASRLLVVEGAMLVAVDLARGAVLSVQQRRLAGPTAAALLQWVHANPAPLTVAMGHGLHEGLTDEITGETLPAGFQWLGSLGDAAPPLMAAQYRGVRKVLQ